MTKMGGDGLFGRSAEIAKLQRAIAAATSGDGQFVVISGEPGIGKTRLLEELVRGSNAAVWGIGRAWESEGAPAYFPWLEALRKIAAEPAYTTIVDAAREDTPELAPFLVRGRVANAPSSLAPAEVRFRLFEAVAELLRACGEVRPVVVALDDVHGADLASLLLLQFVARIVNGNARVLLLATMRDVGYTAALGLDEQLARITREAIALPLGRLERDDVAAWIAAAEPALATVAGRLHAVSEGNPLFVGELLAAAHRDPERRFRTGNELPLGIREAIRAHLALVDAPTLRTLSIASVFGREAERNLVASLAGVPIDGAIDAAVLGGILHETGDGRLRFRHALLRDELYARLAPDERRAFHRAVAALERDQSVAVEHWLLGTRDEDCARVLPVVHEAITEALGRAAFEDAAMLGQRALDRFASVMAPGDACDLTVDVATSWERAGAIGAARQAATRAAAIARDLDDTPRFARATLAHPQEFSLSAQDGPHVTLLREAYARLDSQVDRASALLRVRVCGRLAPALVPPKSPAEREEILRLVDRSIAEAHSLDDAATILDVIHDLAHLLSVLGIDLERRVALEQEAIAIARKLGRAADAAKILLRHVGTHVERGDLEGAIATCDTLERLLVPLRQPHYKWQVPLARAFLADLEGRFADSAAHQATALAIIREGHEHMAESLFAGQRICALHLRGDDVGWSRVASDVHRIIAGPMQAVFWTAVAAITGDRAAIDEGFQILDRIPHELVPEAWVLAFGCAEAGVLAHAGWLERSAAEAEATTPWPLGPGGISSFGPIAVARGRLAAMLGRPDEAILHLRRARGIAERVRARPVLARVDFFLAELLASQRAFVEARERAEASRALATELGMGRVAEAAAALATTLGVALAKGPPARTAGCTLVREGEAWRLAHPRLVKSVLLRDAKGLAYLDVLVRAAGREVHVLELTGNGESGDAGPMLDERAKAEYRARIVWLRGEIDAAEDAHDVGRAERARTELETLIAELARAVGLGGRDRRASSIVERTRINVQRRLRDVVRRVTEIDAALGDHLDERVRTGVYCSYIPD